MDLEVIKQKLCMPGLGKITGQDVLNLIKELEDLRVTADFCSQELALYEIREQKYQDVILEMHKKFSELKRTR